MIPRNSSGPVGKFQNKTACEADSTCCASAPSPSKVGLYIGCYVDCNWINGHSGCTPDIRDMKPITCPPGDDHGATDGCVHESNNQTRENCNAYCKGYKYYGVQDGKQCFCSNSYGSQGKASESDCDFKCTGNSNEICGGGSKGARNSVFARGSCRPL